MKGSEDKLGWQQVHNRQTNRKTNNQTNNLTNKPEWEGVRTDWGDHDSRYTWVDHACPSCHCISCASSRGRHNQTVALINTDNSAFRQEDNYLDGGDEFAVQVEVDVGEVGGRPSVDHHLVQHQLVRGGLYTAPLLLLLKDRNRDAKRIWGNVSFFRFHLHEDASQSGS